MLSDILYKLMKIEKTSESLRSPLCHILRNFSFFQNPDLFNLVHIDVVLSFLIHSLQHYSIVITIDAFIYFCWIILNIGNIVIEKTFFCNQIFLESIWSHWFQSYYFDFSLCQNCLFYPFLFLILIRITFNFC
jgi:hypothetical protein